MHGAPLPPGCPPSPRERNTDADDWTPYTSREQFELAELLYTKTQMSAGNIDHLMKIWSAHGAERGVKPPFLDHKYLYDTIDATEIGDVPWQSFDLSYDGEIPQQPDVPAWMTAKHTVWFRDPRLLVHNNILSNPDFKGTFDTSPYQEYDAKDSHRYHDFVSGNWAWRHAVILFIMHVLISMLIGICRISLLQILRHMGLCLCPLFLAAIRQQFPLPRDTLNIGQYITSP